MGENVTYYTTQDGSLRDMYKPECFLEPTTTLAPYYVCSNLAGDNGGVHKNSGNYILLKSFSYLS
jgi:Zn-dependent metalloprotease